MIRSFIKSHFLLRIMSTKLKLIILNVKSLFEGKYINHGCARLKRNIIGKGNTIVVGRDSFIRNAVVYIRGDNNLIEVGDDCIIGLDCSFRIEGNNCLISIGSGTTMTKLVDFTVQEDNMKIEVGMDCMFSNTIVVRTSDSHIIRDKNHGMRLNNPKSVVIGNHVWISPNSKIMKGAIIGDGSIIGSNTIVGRAYPGNCLIVGAPAKVVKQDIEWTRENLF